MLETIAACTLSFIAGIFLPYYLSKTIVYFQDRALLKSITPAEATKENVCKGPHSWMNANALTEKGPATTQICRLCGLISGTNNVLSSEAIDHIEENIRIREIENKLYSEFLEKEDNDIKNYMVQELNGGLNFDKLQAIHSAGMTFGERYVLYRSAKTKDIEKELYRTDA